MSTQYNVLTAYLRDILYPSPVSPEIKESDAGDILHATYLPYVDLYRTDGRFGALLSKVSIPGTVKVVPKLHQLPEAIEDRLGSAHEGVGAHPLMITFRRRRPSANSEASGVSSFATIPDSLKPSTMI